MGDFRLVHIYRMGTTGKVKRAYLWSYHTHGTFTSMPWTSACCLALPTVCSYIIIARTCVINEGCGALKVHPATTSASRAFSTSIRCIGISAGTNPWYCRTPIRRDFCIAINYEVVALSKLHLQILQRPTKSALAWA